MASRWFEYDWHIEGIDAVFAVDTQLVERTPYSNNPYLFYISCMTPDGEPFTMMQARRAAALVSRCEKLLPIYAGRICAADHHQFYFYGSDRTVQKQLSDECKKVRKLVCRAGRINDPEWSTYLELLYPDAAKYQTELNRRTLEQYEKKGDGIETPRRVNFHCFFPAEPMLMQFSEDARLSGFALGKPEFAPEAELIYGIAAQAITSLEKRDIDKLTTRVMAIASRYDGRLISWDTQVVRRRPPMR